MEKTVCFSGHRPNKLGGYKDKNGIQLNLYKHLARVVEIASMNGFTKFISGGAQGVDQIAARAVINRRNNPVYSHIKLILALPYRYYGEVWPEISRKVLKNIMKRANKVVYTSNEDDFDYKLLFERNVWMVDNSDVLVAVWNKVRAGGTYHCIKYAKKAGKPVLLINPVSLEEKWII